jgi:hypothetical protein
MGASSSSASANRRRAPLDQQPTLIGQADRSGRAVRQRRAIVLLQREQALGDGSRRKPAFPSGRRKIAFFHDAKKQSQVVEDRHSEVTVRRLFDNAARSK